MRNLVKQKLKAGKPAIGTWVTVGHPDMTMYLADMGFDWLVCDMEHSPFGSETYHFMVQSMLYARDKCMPLARIPWTDLIWAKKVLDAGAMGLVVPRIESAEQAKELVRIMKYPPKGERGAGPRLAAFRDPEYFTTANDEILVIPMIESVKGVENLDAIFSVEGIDACFVGPSDLSLDMGIHKQYTNPRFIETLDRIVEAGRAHGVAPGMHCFTNPDTTHINDAIKRGFQFCALDTDMGYLTRVVKSTLASVQGWKPGSAGEAPAV
jgi:2-keto-3-deoxy-L-rhamnonate aldolase RhmA